MKTVKWGILGAARVNQRLLPAIENHPNCEIVMLASRRPNAAQECINKYASNKQEIKASQDFNEVILNQDINAVYIPLANEEHTQIALKAIAQKKHVLIEKPMALSKTEVEQITDAAKANSVMVMEGFMYVFHPQFDFIQKVIQSGKLGKIQYAHSMFSFPIQPARYYRINRSMKNGGGALWDIGPYAAHTLRQVMNAKVKQVMAISKLNSHQADLTTSGIIEFKNETRATFDISFECVRRSEFEVFGDKGRIKCHTVWQHEDDEAVVSIELDGSNPVIQKIEKGNHFDLEINHFVECIQHNKISPILPPKDSVENIATLEACYKSIQNNQWVII